MGILLVDMSLVEMKESSWVGDRLKSPLNVAGAKISAIRDRFPEPVLKVRVDGFLNNGTERAWIIVKGWSIDRKNTDVRVTPSAVKRGENPKRDKVSHLGLVDQVREHNDITANSLPLSHGGERASPCFVRLDKENFGKGIDRQDFPVLVYSCVRDADYISLDRGSQFCHFFGFVVVPAIAVPEYHSEHVARWVREGFR